MHWYCFKSQQKREKFAATSVSQYLGLPTYCPIISYYKSTRRGRIRFTEAMFAGYIFVQADLRESLQLILRTTGIVGAVRYGNIIPMVMAQFIEGLRETMGGDHYEISDVDDHCRSDNVRIVEGPFSGIIGQVTSCLSSDERVKVLVDFLGREVELSVPKSSIIGESDDRRSPCAKALDQCRLRTVGAEGNLRSRASETADDVYEHV